MSETPRLTTYVIAFNEVDKVGDAIRSVLWADEVILVDSGSTDGTAELAERLGARVVQVPFNGFGDLRNQALAACKGEWIFSLDSDERATPEVRDEILQIVTGSPSHDVYQMPRRNFFMGRWIKHSGWYPNYRQPQLFRRGTMRYGTEAVHESYELMTSKPLGTLKHPIWQVPFRNLDEVVRKANRYSTLSLYRLQHKQPSMGSALSHGIWAFIKHYFFKLGLLDGWAGFIIAFGYFEQTFYRYAKRHEQWRNWALPTVEQPIFKRDDRAR